MKTKGSRLNPLESFGISGKDAVESNTVIDGSFTVIIPSIEDASCQPFLLCSSTYSFTVSPGSALPSPLPVESPTRYWTSVREGYAAWVSYL